MFMSSVSFLRTVMSTQPNTFKKTATVRTNRFQREDHACPIISFPRDFFSLVLLYF